MLSKIIFIASESKKSLVFRIMVQIMQQKRIYSWFLHVQGQRKLCLGSKDSSLNGCSKRKEQKM